jgi:Biotin carboxylase, N-terminal domain
MSQGTLLVANRGEIAVRILRTARETGLDVVLVHAEDDGAWIRSDYDCVAHALTGSGPAAYLDREQLVRAAVEHRADRKELASIADAGERDRYFEQQLALLRDRSKAVNAATHFELDDVIDPAATRSWIVSGLKAASARGGAPEPYLDPW